MKNFDLKKYLTENKLVKEDKEYSSNVEAHELLEMIKDEIGDLPLGNDLVIRVNQTGMNGYDVSFETLGSGEDSLDHMFKGTTPDDIDF